MGEQGNHTAQYIAADPEEFQPLSAQIPSPFKGGRLVFGDICADLPGGGGRLSERFERSGLAEARADLLVLRGAGKQFAERVETERELREKIPEGLPVLCLVGSTEGAREPELIRPKWAPAIELEPTLEELRSIELLGLLTARGGILNGSETHYELAGGSHVERYVRLRNALQCSHDTWRVIDWLLPYISENAQILLAHRGLGPLQIALEARVRELLDWKVEVHRLPRYDQTQSRAPHLPVSMESDETRPQLIIVGVDQIGESGAKKGERGQTFEHSGYAGATRVCLLDTSFPDPGPDAFLHIPIERRQSGCELCAAKVPLTRIDPDSERLTPTAAARLPLQVKKPDIRSENDFWRIVDRTSAAQVHVNQRYEDPASNVGRRHRGFDLNVGKLLEDPVFRAEARDGLGHLRPEDGNCAVVIPEHALSDQLGELAEHALGVSSEAVHVVPRLNPAEGLDTKALECSRLILLDDMLVTGATVVGISSKLTKLLGNKKYGELDVRCFVVLNCAATENRVRGVISNLTPGSGESDGLLHHCRRVPLPPTTAQCPWCAERERLERMTGSRLGELHPDFLEDRLDALRQTPLARISPLADPPDQLEDSLLGDISPHTALVRWASAFQCKRDKLRTADEPQPPSYYVDAGFVVLRWKDGPQCGGILRPAEPSEVRYSLQEERFEEEWNLKAADMSLDKLAEFGWAAIEGKLTPPSVDLVRQTLVQRASEDPAIAAFATALEELELTPAAQAA
jgi:hypothetical protein